MKDTPRPYHPTITQALARHAKDRPDDIAIEYVDSNGERTFLNYRILLEQSLRVAAHLRRTCQPQDRILLPTNNTLTFHAAFLGCLMADCIAVPIQVPTPKAKLQDLGLGRFNAIIEDSQCSLVLLDERNLTALTRHLPNIKNAAACPIKLDSIQEILAKTEPDSLADQANPEHIAFLQYTSGSTSSPRGVVIRNSSIVNNQRDIQVCYGVHDKCSIVSWLPLYHDMGLCTGLFLPLYTGCPGLLMAPMTFVSRPYTWLREITNHPNAFSAAPNFAYALCTHRIPDEDLPSLDLSSWHAAVCGAEPIIARDIEAFFARFASAGFKPTTFCPSFGLAEGTLMVSGFHPGRPTRITRFSASSLAEHRVTPTDDTQDSTRLVGCGMAAPGVTLRIVDPKTHQEVSARTVGEIAVDSESAGDGYWNNPQASRATFGHDLEGNGHSRYFMTGDLGFIHEGELYVSGRRKDLIIVSGANYYPQDIEQTAQQQHPDLPLYRAAAFDGAIDDRSGVALVIEAPRRLIERQAGDLRSDIIRAVRSNHNLTLSDVVFVHVGSIPKTSSGKVQRQRCAQLYRKGHYRHPATKPATEKINTSSVKRTSP